MQQCPIALEQNEVSTLKPWLTEGLCQGRILTADGPRVITSLGGGCCGREAM